MDTVEEGNDAWTAGVRAGDVLLVWSRGNVRGSFVSPFDLTWIETEQKPYGKITLEGLRAGKTQTWVLGHDLWYLQVRPNFSEALLILYQDAERLVKSGKITEAESKWQEVAGALPASQQSLLACWFYSHAGKAQSDARKWQDADAYFKTAESLAPADHPEILSSVLSSWAVSFGRRNDLEKAGALFEQSEEASLKLRSPDLAQAYPLQGLAGIWWLRGSPEKAEEYYQAALDIRVKLTPESLETASTLRSVAVMAEQRGDMTRAEKLIRQALAKIEILAPGNVTMAAMYLNLASISRQRGDLVLAEDSYRRSVVIHQNVGARGRGLMIGLTGLGNIAGLRGDLDGAQRYYEESLVISREVNQGASDAAIALSNLAIISQKRGNLDQAEKQFGEALQLAEKVDINNRGAAHALGGLGEIRFLRGDWENAGKMYERALAIQRKSAPHTLAVADMLMDLGEVALTTGDLAKAGENYREALALREELAPGSNAHAVALAAMGRVMLQKHDPEGAATFFAKALEAFDTQTARLGGSDDARAGYRASHGKFYTDYIGLLVSGRQNAAALQVLENFRARTMLDVLTFAQLNLRHGANHELLEKEQSLRSDITAKVERRIRILSGKHTPEQVTAVDKEISGLNSEYQEIEAQIRSRAPSYAALTQPRPLSSQEIQRQLLDRNTLLLEYSLGEERSYVFAVTPDSLEVFELPKRSEIEKQSRRVYELLTARNKSVKDETVAQRQQRWSRAERDFAPAAAELSRMILTPVAVRLKNKRLLLVADGALHYVPFAALPEPALFAAPSRSGSAGSVAPKPFAPGGSQTRNSLANAAPATPLALNHEIINLPSASVLALLRQQETNRKPAPSAVAVLADPVFSKEDSRIDAQPSSKVKVLEPQAGVPDQLNSSLSASLLTRSATDLGMSRNGQLDLSRLLFSRQEADAILAVTPQGASLEAVDFNASRATATSAQLSQYRIVHFATHGLLNSEHPELSGLVLSLVNKNGEPQDGFLSLQDIYSMNLPADLVVLSACETGLGKEISGEGLIGLTRGFMYAGATRVVASLWNVSDLATAKLMADFYRAMERDNQTPAAALRAAQVRMWKQKRWNAPYYWAAFQIQGEWK